MGRPGGGPTGVAGTSSAGPSVGTTNNALSGAPVGVEVSVEDDGVGIPARDRERIFERFYRVDRARSRATGGTGLGLSIVRHVAANHGGTVGVHSVEGRVPLLSSACRRWRSPRARAIPDERKITLPEALSVLVVEDEESFVEALVVGLKREGFVVTVARDGVDGVELFDKVRPDLILLDLWLPKRSGIDVCRQIRARSRVPIIMVTAKSSEIDTVVGLEVGADDYVTKPFRLRELVARMRAVMRRVPMNDETPDEGESLEVDGLSLDPDRHEVSLRGELVPLPLKEFELLEILMANAGRVLTRETLIDRIWGPNYVGDTKTLDVHIKRLRAKVEDDPSRPVRITTVRGLGYKSKRRRPSSTHPSRGLSSAGLGA